MTLLDCRLSLRYDILPPEGISRPLILCRQTPPPGYLSVVVVAIQGKAGFPRPSVNLECSHTLRLGNPCFA